jgi:acetyltransferase-like isoleucine patch superfamily enzyme
MGTVRPLPTVVPARTSHRTWRWALKRLSLVLAWIVVSPLIVLVWLEGLVSSQRLFDDAKELLAHAPGLPGKFLRAAFYSAVCRDVSTDTSFGLGSIVSTRNVAIGSGTVIGNLSIVGRAEIGRDVMIASRVSIVSDPYLHSPTRTQRKSPARPAVPPAIGDGCWIGENAVVMASLGARCTVAAGAVVVRAAEPDTTLMGNPARKVNL